MADAKLTGLTEQSVLAVDDWLYSVDKSDTTDDAAGSSRKLAIDRLAGFFFPSICQGRLTLETGVAISTTDQTAKTTIYFTPHAGNRVSVYDGTRWKLYSFAEVSLALGTLSSGANYDVFLYDNAGTLTLEFSAAWTNATTRADALTTQDGVYVKSGATTRRFLGTFRTTATTTTEDSAVKRFVWNHCNQVERRLLKTDSTASWTYTTDDTTRQARGDATNQVEVVVGLATSLIHLTCVCRVDTALNAAACVGIGEDSTTALAAEAQSSGRIFAPSSVLRASNFSALNKIVPLGYHAYVWLERVISADTVTFYGEDATTLERPGLAGGIAC